MFVKFKSLKDEDLIVNADKVFIICSTNKENVYRIFFEDGEYYDVKIDSESLTMCLRFLNN